MRYKKLLLILLLTVALLPYFLLCFYALPFADDFCTAWTASEKIPFIEKFLKQYLYWNGRYSANALSNLHPLITGKLLWYQMALFTSLLLSLAAFLGFISQFIKDFYISLIVSFFVALFYLCYLPDITEGVYWYMGIVNYQLGNVCFLFHLILLHKLFASQGGKKIFLVSLAALLLIIATGFNEIAAVLIPSFYLLAAIVSYRLKTPQRLLIVFFFIIALTASALVIFSPGNIVRSGHFAERYHLVHSLYYAALQTLRFIAIWALSIPFMGLSLLAIVYAAQIQNRFIRQFDYRLILVFLLFTVYMGSFLPYFSMGILGQHRTINYVFFYFVLLWLWFLIAVSEKFSLHETFAFLKTGNRSFVIALICAICMAFSSTGCNIISDFRNNKFSAYRKNFMQRQADIIAEPNAPIEPLKDIPATFNITDARRDSTWWVNKCMKRFYGVTAFELK